MAMVLIYKRRVSATTWFDIWILKKTININIRNNVVNIRCYRASKLINYILSDKFSRYFVSFSFHIFIIKNCWKVDEFNCIIRKFNVTNVFLSFLGIPGI